ncbi:MAG: 30S ribosomal protein S6 [Armatimonadota bacterium]
MSEPTLYEAIYILDTSLPDEEAAQIIASLEDVVREAGGEVVDTRDFRVRRLAYEIDGHTHGAYKLLYFHGDGAVVEAVRSEMAIRQPIIRSRVFVANPMAIVGGAQEAEAAEVESMEGEEAEEAAVAEAEALAESDEADVVEAAEAPEAEQ